MPIAKVRKEKIASTVFNFTITKVFKALHSLSNVCSNILNSIDLFVALPKPIFEGRRKRNRNAFFLAARQYNAKRDTFFGGKDDTFFSGYRVSILLLLSAGVSV